MRLKEKWGNMIGKIFSFIIINYNYREDICKLIVSIEKSILHKNYEIIIIDNASTDGSKEYFSNINSNIIYHYLDKNIGYGAANNIGVSLAVTDLIVLINPDTLIISKEFDRLIALAESEKIVLSPQIIYPDGKIQPNCASYSTCKIFIMQSLMLGYFVRKFNFIKKLQIIVDNFAFMKNSFIGVYLDNFSETFSEKECDWISGACMIMHKTIYDKINGFDENFFLYCEDEDLCRRIREKDFIVCINAEFKIIHNEGFIKARQNKMLTMSEIYRFHSSIYYLKKYEGTLSAKLLSIFYFLRYGLSGIFYLFINQKIAKTYFSFLSSLIKK